MRTNAHVHAFGMTLIKQAPPSAKGMVFITLEDEKGFINLAFDPKTYRKFHQLIEGHGFLCISGKLQKASNYHSILVERVHPERRTDIKELPLEKSQEHQQQGLKLKVKPRNYF